MTEAEWRVSTDPGAMLAGFPNKQGGCLPGRCVHQVRRFAVACGRRVWDHLSASQRRLLDKAEESLRETNGAFSWAVYMVEVWRYGHGYEVDVQLALRLGGAFEVEFSACAARQSGDPAGERRVQADLLRCLIGNPFRPVSGDPLYPIFGHLPNLAWRSANVAALARWVCQSGDFGVMPILADALEEAGCDNSDVLDHCRGPGAHVLGCWVIELLNRV
jgi:hypothetical protein